MTDSRERKLKGIAVSSGIIIGKAHLIDRSRVKILYQYLISDQQVNKEVERFKDALMPQRTRSFTSRTGCPSRSRDAASSWIPIS